MEIVSDDTLMDLYGEAEGDQLVSVPGFGFYPQHISELLDNLTLVKLDTRKKLPF